MGFFFNLTVTLTVILGSIVGGAIVVTVLQTIGA